MLKSVVQERGRRLAVKVGGKRRVFPSRRNFNDTAYLIANAVYEYCAGKKQNLPYVVFDAVDAYLFITTYKWFNVCYSPYPSRFFLLYGKSKECRGLLQSVWQSYIRTPTDQEIRDDLAYSLASFADEEREFIVAYYRQNASQKRRKNFQRKERRQRRSNGN